MAASSTASGLAAAGRPRLTALVAMPFIDSTHCTAITRRQRRCVLKQRQGCVNIPTGGKPVPLVRQIAVFAVAAAFLAGASAAIALDPAVESKNYAKGQERQ